MKIGDYVRTINGKIWIIKSQQAISGHKKDIIKYSDELINLIEVGDYVNGEKITKVIPEDVCGDEVLDYQHIFVGDKEIYKEDIKSIVTKEQFEKYGIIFGGNNE